jgi:SnoaL-like protein
VQAFRDVQLREWLVQVSFGRSATRGVPLSMSVENNKTVVHEFADAINARDWDRLDRTVAPDCRRHSSAGPDIRSREELKQYLRSEFNI